MEDQVLNKTPLELEEMYQQLGDDDVVREAMYNFVSRMLMDYTEDNPYQCDICLENEDMCGLSSLDMPWVVSMWQSPGEGFIWLKMDYGCKYEFTDLSTYEQLQIVMSFD